MKFFFEKIRLIFDLENWLWKYNFGTFWGLGAMSIYKIQQFHLSTVDFWAKTLLFRTNQARNSMTYITDINIHSSMHIFQRHCTIMTQGQDYEVDQSCLGRFTNWPRKSQVPLNTNGPTSTKWSQWRNEESHIKSDNLQYNTLGRWVAGT